MILVLQNVLPWSKRAAGNAKRHDNAKTNMENVRNALLIKFRTAGSAIALASALALAVDGVVSSLPFLLLLFSLFLPTPFAAKACGFPLNTVSWKCLVSPMPSLCALPLQFSSLSAFLLGMLSSAFPVPSRILLLLSFLLFLPFPATSAAV